MCFHVFLCFYSFWPPQEPSCHLCLPFLPHSVFNTKGQASFSSSRVRAPPSSARHYFLIQSPSLSVHSWSLLSLCLLANSSLTFSNTLLSVPFYLLAGAMELTLNESSDWGKKEYKKIKGKCRHAHAQSLSFPLCLVPYFRHHKLPATGYRFLLQHTTCCHLVLIRRWSLAKKESLLHRHAHTYTHTPVSSPQSS